MDVVNRVRAHVLGLIRYPEHCIECVAVGRDLRLAWISSLELEVSVQVRYRVQVRVQDANVGIKVVRSLADSLVDLLVGSELNGRQLIGFAVRLVALQDFVEVKGNRVLDSRLAEGSPIAMDLPTLPDQQFLDQDQFFNVKHRVRVLHMIDVRLVGGLERAEGCSRLVLAILRYRILQDAVYVLVNGL